MIGDDSGSNAGTETGGMTDSQMHSFPGDGGHNLKRYYEETRPYEELLAELHVYRDREEKRKKRKQKKNEKGIDFKKLDNIPTENRLDDDGDTRLGKMVRSEVWPQMKYYTAYQKEDLLCGANSVLGLKQQGDKDKYADYIVAYVDKKLITHTHNCVGYLKRKIMEGGKNGGKKMETLRNVHSMQTLTHSSHHNLQK